MLEVFFVASLGVHLHLPEGERPSEHLRGYSWGSDDSDNAGLQIRETSFRLSHTLSPSEWQERVFLLFEKEQNSMAQGHLQNDRLHILGPRAYAQVVVGKYREMHTYVHLHRSYTKGFLR